MDRSPIDRSDSSGRKEPDEGRSFDVDAYLARIGMPRPSEPDLGYADSLVLSHQCSVPFENLDCYDLGKVPDTSMGAVFAKVVRDHRGGYCFEINKLFHRLLSECGYRAWPISCSVLHGSDHAEMMLHRATLVEIDGSVYYCDVGIGGPQPAGLVPLDGSRTLLGEHYSVERDDGPWCYLVRHRDDGTCARLVAFLDFPVPDGFFVPFNHYCSTSADSKFTRRRIVNMRTHRGSLSLVGGTLTERCDGRTTVTEYDRCEDLAMMLREKFGIEVQPSDLRVRFPSVTPSHSSSSRTPRISSCDRCSRSCWRRGIRTSQM